MCQDVQMLTSHLRTARIEHMSNGLQQKEKLFSKPSSSAEIPLNCSTEVRGGHTLGTLFSKIESPWLKSSHQSRESSRGPMAKGEESYFQSSPLCSPEIYAYALASLPPSSHLPSTLLSSGTNNTSLSLPFLQHQLLSWAQENIPNYWPLIGAVMRHLKMYLVPKCSAGSSCDLIHWTNCLVQYSECLLHSL